MLRLLAAVRVQSPPTALQQLLSVGLVSAAIVRHLAAVSMVHRRQPMASRLTCFSACVVAESAAYCALWRLLSSPIVPAGQAPCSMIHIMLCCSASRHVCCFALDSCLARHCPLPVSDIHFLHQASHVLQHIRNLKTHRMQMLWQHTALNNCSNPCSTRSLLRMAFHQQTNTTVN